MKNLRNMNFNRYIQFVLIAALCLVTACGDDDSTPPQAAATFTASKTTVAVNEEIQFTNTSQNATAFKWSFGDGTTSTDVAPKKSYTEAGTFLVSLVSTGAGGSSISSLSITVVPDEIYYIDYSAGELKKLTLDASAALTDILDLEGRSGVSLAYDAEHGKIYYSDFENYYEGKIWRMNLDGSGAEVIVDGLYNPYQIALDVDGGKVYWTDDADEDTDYTGHIGRANLDGTNVETDLVSKEEALFRGIALDPENDKMYYYDVNYEVLYVSDLDGSNEEVFLDGIYGYSLAVDTVHDRIYFDDQNEEGLFSAALDGSDVQLVDDNGSRIYGIVIDYKHDKLIWSGRDSRLITRSSLDGSGKETLKSDVNNVRGLILKN